MKSYLVEFNNLVSKDPIIKVFHGTEGGCWLQAVKWAEGHDYVDTFNFDMYPIFRNAEDGSLYLGGWNE